MRRVLYGLYELLKVHMEKEEEVCLPMLDRSLSDEQLRALTNGLDLFDAAEQAAW